MDPDRKRQILNAEERFTLRERLSRALAEKGVYVLGRLTHEPTPDPEAESPVATLAPAVPDQTETGKLYQIVKSPSEP